MLLANEMFEDYDIYVVNTSGKTEDQVLESVISILDSREKWDKKEALCDFT